MERLCTATMVTLTTSMFCFADPFIYCWAVYISLGDDGECIDVGEVDTLFGKRVYEMARSNGWASGVYCGTFVQLLSMGSGWSLL
jgi:hypothetical protein